MLSKVHNLYTDQLVLAPDDVCSTNRTNVVRNNNLNLLLPSDGPIDENLDILCEIAFGGFQSWVERDSSLGTDKQREGFKSMCLHILCM